MVADIGPPIASTAPMTMDDPINPFCLLDAYGELSENAFVVKTVRSEMVSKLKDLILNKMPHYSKNNDASNRDPRKVEIPKDKVPQNLSSEMKMSRVRGMIKKPHDRELISGSLGNGMELSMNIYPLWSQKQKEKISIKGSAGSKRKPVEDSHYEPQKIYGIVTTGTIWAFLRLEYNTGLMVEVHNKAPLQIYLSSLETGD